MTTQEINASSDTLFTSPNQALSLLCIGWTQGLQKSPDQPTLETVEMMISDLERFRAAVRQQLPVESGGFEGLSREQAIKALRNVAIEVYETGGGYFGFTGCDADQWECFDDAINAALKYHPEAVPQKVTLAVKGEVSAS